MVNGMKGIVFVELMDFISAKHGADMVDDVIGDCRLPNDGAYTSVGRYDHAEMQALVSALAQRTGMGAPDILVHFGRHLCRRFAELFPDFFRARSCLFDFLESVHDHIHVEVHKLYPDAELPSFQTHARDDRSLELDYRSCRPLAAFAEGLILGASDFFREPITVTRSRYDDPGGGFVRFTIQHVP